MTQDNTQDSTQNNQSEHSELAIETIARELNMRVTDLHDLPGDSVEEIRANAAQRKDTLEAIQERRYGFLTGNEVAW